EVGAQCGISETSVHKIIKSSKKGIDPTARKPLQKITTEICDEVKELQRKIEKGELSQEKVGDQCGICETSVNKIVKSIKKGIDPTARKPLKKITPEIRDKVKELQPKIEKGELTQEKVGDQCGISETSVHKIIKSIKEGVDPTAPKPFQTYPMLLSSDDSI